MVLFAELERRSVFRVAVAYLVFAWLVLQVADVAFQRFDYADVLAGLDDEAIAELRFMLEQRGGRSLRMADAWPAFERLDGQPGYEALRAEFGDTE